MQYSGVSDEVYRRFVNSPSPGSYYRDNATIETYANEMASFVTNGYRAVKAKCCWAEMSEEVERIAASDTRSSTIRLNNFINAPVAFHLLGVLP